MPFLEYQRLVIAFHGCDRKTAEAVFAAGSLHSSLAHIQIAVRDPAAIIGCFHPSRLDAAGIPGD